MQKFSYHTHTNILGFDGKNTAEEMIKKAEEIGFEEIGISNHFIYHPNLQEKDNMFFNDIQKMETAAKKIIESIRQAALNSKIKVYAGFEVDFFPSARWRSDFEKIRKNIDADYFIGSTHILRDKDEQHIYNMYHYYYKSEHRFKDDILQEYLSNYWKNIAAAIKSGYFDFIAHLDVYRIFKLFENNLCRLFSAFFFFLDDFLQLQKRNLFILYPVLQHVFRFYISKLKVLLQFFALFIIGKPAQLFHPIIHNFFSRHSE